MGPSLVFLQRFRFISSFTNTPPPFRTILTIQLPCATGLPELPCQCHARQVAALLSVPQKHNQAGPFWPRPERTTKNKTKRHVFQWLFLVPLKDGIGAPNWQEKYHLYTTYSPCLLGGLYNHYHLLPEPEKSIEFLSNICVSIAGGTPNGWFLKVWAVEQ